VAARNDVDGYDALESPHDVHQNIS